MLEAAPAIFCSGAGKVHRVQAKVFGGRARGGAWEAWMQGTQGCVWTKELRPSSSFGIAWFYVGLTSRFAATQEHHRVSVRVA